MLIQNTDVIVTGRASESLNKYSYILHELALSEVCKFLWFGSFLYYVSEPITQRGEERESKLWFCVWVALWFWKKGVTVMTVHSFSSLGKE